MPEAVIVDSVRTPVGRAFKGSLAQLRPDETGAYVIDQLLERNPDVAPDSVEEVIAGCGLPQGKQAFNIGRIMVLLSEKLSETTNGSTVSRYCASGLDAIRIAANNVVAGQGDTYIAVALEELVDDVRTGLVRAELRERALEGAPHGRADAVDDHCFRH